MNKMEAFNFVTVRLGKDSINDIKLICSSGVGIVDQVFNITVKCTQIPDNYAPNDYAFIWLGSDNNKGAPTKWKQGFKAVGKVTNIKRGSSYNDTSETTLDILYIFREAINRLDILRCAPSEYYWCSSFPLIGIDDHANQTIRLMSGAELSNIKSFFSALDKTSDFFKEEITKVQPDFEPYFDVYIPCPKDYPNFKSLSDIKIEKESIDNKDFKSLQLIFFGAPGTGKSDTIDRAVQDVAHTRTTFHPDSDYASFVGAYKPTMKPVADKYKAVAGKDEEIAYSFIPQAFLKAYCAAWKQMPDPYFLVIEEINRGNCAQIFGDLFQLLDRDENGYSKYEIAADDDIRKFLSQDQNVGFGALSDEQKELFPKESIWKGEELILPPNLRIWATMNTSDQSLFPIDSAFKRRWEWKYIKITNGYKKDKAGKYIIDAEGNKIKLNWKIETNGQDWYGFIQQTNKIISNMTSSADKQLGYFFCQANKDGKISTETFVSKVVFYLWNDVFKDYGFEDASLFKYKKKAGEKEVEEDLTFPDFYDEDGNVLPDVVKQFIEHVMAWKGDDKKENN
jgi:hypothetical protein